MSDFNSSLPVRTQNNGDVVAFIADPTTTTQLASVDANGSLSVLIKNASGTATTSQANGSQQALDVGINVAGVQIDPRQIRALTAADVVTANQGTAAALAGAWPVEITDGTNVLGTAAHPVRVDPTGTTPQPVTQSSGPWTINLTEVGGSAIALGQTTMSASVPVTIASDQSPVPVTVSNLPTTLDTNYGTVGASTLRTASQIGNATGAADFNNGATGAQTLRVAANLAVAGANVSSTNPVPVSITSAPVGTTVNNYNTVASVAAGSSSNHIYTITASKTFNGKKIHASASGKLKIEVRVSPDGSTYSTLWVGFNSTANPNIDIDLDELVFLESGSGSTVEVIRTNLDLVAFDVYSTISGVEV